MFLAAAVLATLMGLLALYKGEWGAASVCGVLAFILAFAKP
jgi:hypothetical protein